MCNNVAIEAWATQSMDAVLDEIKWTAEGLVPAIAQDWQTGEVLMMAWMNRQSLAQTITTGEAVYWSRSRQRLWHKGESSGHHQRIVALRLDCDGDVLLLSVEQIGNIACHTGRRSCFYRRLSDGEWQITDDIITDPGQIYGTEHE